jgi:hypothetical protein
VSVEDRCKKSDTPTLAEATWRKPRGTRLTPTSRYIRDMLFPNGYRPNITKQPELLKPPEH